MEQTTELAVRQDVAPLSILELKSHVKLIDTAMKDVMIEDTHFGKIPGIDKPSLLKAGAEKLLLLFRLDPEYVAEEVYDGPHLTITSTCTIYHAPSGMRMGSGMGLCTTKEVKYAYRSSKRKCPVCGKETIIVGKKEYGGGFLCWTKKGGCGEKFLATDTRITSQTEERVENEDIADTYNTVIKMSNKRALVAAVLNVTAASDIFTQDVEEWVDTTTGEVNKSEPVKQERPQTEPPARGRQNAPVKTTEVKQAPAKGRYKASELDIANDSHTESIDKVLGLFGCTLQHSQNKKDGKTFKNFLVLGHLDLIPMIVWDDTVNKSGGKSGDKGFVSDRDPKLGKHLSFNSKSFNPFIRQLGTWWLNNPDERPDVSKLEAMDDGADSTYPDEMDTSDGSDSYV